MKHLKTYEEAINEGLFSRIKEWLYPKIFRISYTVEHKRKKEEEKKGKFRIASRYFDVKAKDEDAAEDKFWEMVNKEIKDLDPKPTVEITSIYETKKIEHKHIKIK